MKNFSNIAWLDTFQVTGEMWAREPDKWPGIAARGEIGDVRLPVKSLFLRGPEDATLENWTDDLPIVDKPEYEWPAMRKLIEQARAEILVAQAKLGIKILDTKAEIGRIMVSGLQPDGVIMWHTDNGAYHDRHVRFHISLVTNPLAFLHSEHEQIHLAAGSLWYFNNRVRHCAANWGDTVRYHVVFEMPKSG